VARGTKQFVFSDVYNLDRIVQHTGILAGRNLLIDVLREIFARDREYRYLRDIYGFPKTPSHVGLDPDAGIVDDSTTRLFIGSAYRYDISYLPAIIVRQTSSSYVPVSFNQNRWVVEYETQRIIDGYGNVEYIQVPSHYSYAGAWNQTFEVKVMARSLEDVVSIADVVLISLQGTYRPVLQQNGLFVRSVSAGGESAETIGANDPFFSISITVNTRSEWRREVPVSTLVDRIAFCFTIDLVDTDVPASDLTIKTQLDLAQT
jgi:hypothetical protein